MNILRARHEAAAPTSREDCALLDANDELASYRERFELSKNEIYLDGNSLGALPRSVVERMKRAVSEEWGKGQIRSWNDADWYMAPQRAGAKIARLIGAEKDEVIVCDSTSVNLFKLMVAAARMRPDRKVIVSEKGNFPTDVYIASGVADLLGLELRCVEPDSVLDAMRGAGDKLAMVQLTHVNYRSGQIYDMAQLTSLANELGALSIWDLAHSAGAMPIRLNECGVDFAVGCGYKYLNGGPGAPAFAFAAKRHFDSIRQPLTGWHGHSRPFDFTHEYEAHAGISKMLVGTAPQLSLIALEESLSVFDGVDMQLVRKKSSALGNLFIRLVDQELSGFGFGIFSPRNDERRGSQVSLTHENGYAIMQALISRGVVGDFRAPDILRFGFAPLYVGYTDIWDAIAILRSVMDRGDWDRAEFRAKKAVT